MKHNFRSVCLSLLFFASFSTYAEGWTEPGTVSYVHPWGVGFRFIIQGVGYDCGTLDNPNPNNQFFVPWSAGAISDKLYALVLAAFSSGKPIAVNYYCDPEYLGTTTDIDVRLSMP